MKDKQLMQIDEIITDFEEYKNYLLSRIKNCKGRDLEGGMQRLFLVDRVKMYFGNTSITIKPENTLGDRLYEHIEGLEDRSKEPLKSQTYDYIIIRNERNRKDNFFDFDLDESPGKGLYLCKNKEELWAYSFKFEDGKKLDPDTSRKLIDLIPNLPSAYYSVQNDYWKISNNSEEDKQWIEQFSLGCPHRFTNPKKNQFDNMSFRKFSPEGNILARKFYEATKLQKRLIEMKQSGEDISSEKFKAFKNEVDQNRKLFEEKTGTAGQGLFEAIFQKIANLFRGGTHSERLMENIDKALEGLEEEKWKSAIESGLDKINQCDDKVYKAHIIDIYESLMQVDKRNPVVFLKGWLTKINSLLTVNETEMSETVQVELVSLINIIQARINHINLQSSTRNSKSEHDYSVQNKL